MSHSNPAGLLLYLIELSHSTWTALLRYKDVREPTESLVIGSTA